MSTAPHAMAKTGDAHAGLLALERSGIGAGARVLAPRERPVDVGSDRRETP